MPASTAINGAMSVLRTADPKAKALIARDLRENWLNARNIGSAAESLTIDPARPVKPYLVPPSDLKSRGIGSPEGRAALLHSIAHIELNAIDLAADMIARFSYTPELSDDVRAEFIDDWSSVCDDEARHFLMLQGRLEKLDHIYGDFPAHNGLWQAAKDTAHDFTARLAIAPLVLEARGLDVTPGIIKKLTQVRDMQSVEILQIIYNEEIRHVGIGAKWFRYAARIANKDAASLFHEQVEKHFKGQLKPPFNVQARTLAGLTQEFYHPLATKR